MALTHNKDDRDPKLNSGDGPAPKAIGGVADTLRSAREAHRQNLRAVAQVLRIRYNYLEALESGAFERLGGCSEPRVSSAAEAAFRTSEAES